MNSKALKVLFSVAMAILSFLVAFPFILMILTALKTLPEVMAPGFNLLPKQLVWGNFAEAMTRGQWGRYFVNSLIVTVIFTPKHESPLFLGSLTITSNDPDEPEIDVVLKGRGIPKQNIRFSIEDMSVYPGQKNLSAEVRVSNPMAVSECFFAITYDTIFISLSDK